MAYTEEERTEFVELAAKIGYGPAMDELGYPKSRSTARNWAQDRGVNVPREALKAMAAELREFYGMREQMQVLQTMLERTYEAMDREGLSADSLVKLSKTAERTIKTMRLIQGEVTDRTESIGLDKMDAELQEMLNEAKAKNAVTEQQMREAEAEYEQNE